MKSTFFAEYCVLKYKRNARIQKNFEFTRFQSNFEFRKKKIKLFFFSLFPEQSLCQECTCF